MKLYATIASERASKGQGGNKHIKIALNVGSKTQSRTIAQISLIAKGNEYTVAFADKEKRNEGAQVIKRGQILESQ